VRVLVVLAHPERRSFNGVLADTAVSVLQDAGHEVRLSDLYGMGFKAVADADDFAGDLEDPAYFRLDREQTAAHGRHGLAPDITAEQDKLAWADLLVLQYPMWWFGPPAILKGWADRVFTRGFAYRPGRKYDTGLLAGKTAMVSVTTGTSEDTYAPDGIDGAVLDVLWPVHNGLLRYTGFDVLEPFVTYAPRALDAAAREAVLAAWRERLRRLDEVPRLFFHPAADYGPDQRLRPDVTPRSGFQHAVPGRQASSVPPPA
jgi:NAD(P)H dehydrogenase (quinone)